MKVVFVNRFFHPDISATSQLLTDLAFHLARTMEVHVVTGRQPYTGKAAQPARRETVRGVEVHRVWTTRFGRGRLRGRVFDYLTFHANAFVTLLRLLRRADLVVALTDPPLVSVSAALAARLRGAGLVNWLQDVFPETAVALGVPGLSGPIGRWAAALRNASLRFAAVNVALSERMAETLVGLGAPRAGVRVIHNWADGERLRPLPPEANALRRQWIGGDAFVVGYSGNMGRAHELDPILKAAERLRRRRDIVFLFIGEGHRKEELLAAVAARGLANVVFHPYQPRELLPQSLTVPDCHVVSLKPLLEGLVFPSKLYSSLAAGRPVIFVGARDAEIAGLMAAAAPFGRCVAPDDDEAFADAIEAFASDRQAAARCGESGRRLFEARFDMPRALALWSEALGAARAAAAPGRLHL